MKIRLVFAVLYVQLVSLAPAQTSYAEYSALKKRIVFFDDFSDEKNRWDIISVDSMNYAEVKNGYLCLNVVNGSLELFKNKPFDQKKDWEIEIAAKREMAADAEFGIGWGGVPKSQKRFLFLIDNRNFYIKNEKSRTLNRNNTETNRIYSADQNTLTIRKIHNKIYFFINKKQVYSMQNEAWFGSVLSFPVEKESKILIDYISISYLEAAEIIDREPPVSSNFSIRKTFGTKAYLNFEVADLNGISEITHNGKTIDFVSAINVPVSLYLNLQNKVNAIELKAIDGFGNTADTTVYIDANGYFVKCSETQNENFYSGKKIALIIGNAKYVQTMPLINPINDAKLMTTTLKNCGFETVTMQNIDIKTFKDEFSKFVNKSSVYDVALFYFAGHGFNINKTNYLLFIDGVLDYTSKTVKNAVGLDSLITVLSKSVKQSIFILDACRNNPFRNFESYTGFVKTDPPKGSIVAFAASEGQVADDGLKNGLFTEELVRQILIPQKIEDVFKNTRQTILKKSNQNPIEMSNFIGDFYFKMPLNAKVE